MENKRVLVVGADGQLGRCFKKLKEKEWIFANKEQVDITNIDSIWKYVEEYQINIIINCAAYTNVDEAENNYDKAHSINAIGAENLANVMRDVDGWLFHISTDYVFGNDVKPKPLTETDSVSPSNTYGSTKLCGEVLIGISECKHIIFRTSWLYSEYCKNFFTTMMNLTSEKAELKVVIDQIGTPTYAMDLAEYICKIIDNNLYEGNEGIYNFSNEGACSWFDFASEINTISGHKCQIKPCLSEDFPSKVKRPHYSVLSKEKAKNAFKMDIPYWRDSLIKCFEHHQLLMVQLAISIAEKSVLFDTKLKGEV